ncbi:MAG: glycosyltransferase family 2 protein [bacterium]|nr:glycosyltransferase family 2 protein [bacterium]
MLELSVIIPTHKRADILDHCIHHLEKQTIADKLEVIVIHDGQDEKTDALFDNTAFHIPVRYGSIPKSQQGVARNVGVQKAQASTCLFIGDDIFLESHACEHHLEAHRKIAEQGKDPAAVLGFTTWDPAVGTNDVMHWLETSGWQFGYPKIQKYKHRFLPKTIAHKFTYTSHISVPTSVAKKFPFDKDVKMYGWEDVHWGSELRDANVHLYYEPDARALHHHFISMEDSLKRMETLGRSIAAFPSLDRRPTGWKLWAYRLSALLPTMVGRHRRAFLKGLQMN